MEITEAGGQTLKLILALRIEQLMRTIVVGFRDQDLGQSVQISVVGQACVDEFLRGRNPMLLQHHNEHLGVDHRACVKQFHVRQRAMNANDFHAR